MTRLINPQWNGNQINQQRTPQPKRDRHGHFFYDKLSDRLPLKKRLTKIKGRVVFEHQPKALRRRFVKAILRLDTLDHIFRQSACALVSLLIAGRTFFHCLTRLALFNQCDLLLNRAARSRLDNHKIRQQYQKQRW